VGGDDGGEGVPAARARGPDAAEDGSPGQGGELGLRRREIQEQRHLGPDGRAPAAHVGPLLRPEAVPGRRPDQRPDELRDAGLAWRRRQPCGRRGQPGVKLRGEGADHRLVDHGGPYQRRVGQRQGQDQGGAARDADEARRPAGQPAQILHLLGEGPCGLRRPVAVAPPDGHRDVVVRRQLVGQGCERPRADPDAVDEHDPPALARAAQGSKR